MIYLYPNLFDLYLVPIFFILGFLIIYKLKVLTDLSLVEINTIYFYHTFMCLAYYYISINNHNDSIYYYKNVFTHDVIEYNFRFGTKFIHPIANRYKFKFISFTIIFIFNIIGSLGLIFIYNAFKK